MKKIFALGLMFGVVAVYNANAEFIETTETETVVESVEPAMVQEVAPVTEVVEEDVVAEPMEDSEPMLLDNVVPGDVVSE